VCVCVCEWVRGGVGVCVCVCVCVRSESLATSHVSDDSEVESHNKGQYVTD
jgi:hypothetical protein